MLCGLYQKADPDGPGNTTVWSTIRELSEKYAERLAAHQDMESTAFLEEGAMARGFKGFDLSNSTPVSRNNINLFSFTEKGYHGHWYRLRSKPYY